MTRARITWFAALCASACSSPPERSSADEQDLWQLQGPGLQGVLLAGTAAAGMTLVGFQFGGATLGGAALSNVRIENGELVAEQNQVTLRGTGLKDAHVIAQLHNVHMSPPTTLAVEFWISDIVAESATYDPTSTGHTYLYTLQQNVDNTGSWQIACPADLDGSHVAIPTTAIWDEHGDRAASSTLFTFGCTTGAVAKCYRWGYRPWLTGHGDLVATHWACTRLARADYCGNGTSHTRDRTEINMWDNLSSPGPIQSRVATPLGMLFEAGWDSSGAVCFSHARWLLDGPLIALGCPGRLLAPGLGILNATVCDTIPQVLGQAADATIFNDSNLNLNLDLF